MKISHAHKFLAILLSVVLLISCVPMFVSADGFVEENLFETKLDSENSHGILFDHRGKTVSSSTGGGIATNGVVAGLVDGDTTTAHDIWGMSSNYAWGEGYNWYGVQYKLTEVSFASRVEVYGDYENMEHYYDIYASESEADLYCGLNYMGKIYCDGTVQTVNINKDVQYVAIVLDAITSGDTNARLKEIQLWSGDETNAFVPVDLTDASLNKYTSYSSVSINSSTFVTSAWDTGNSSNNSEMTKLAYIASNVTGSHEDFNPNSNYGGFMFTFDDMYYIGDVVIDSDLWTYDQDWAIYASTSSSNLLTTDSLVADNIHCRYGVGNRVTLNTYAQYVAIVFKGYTRVRAIRIYTADSTGVPAPFISENVLLTDSGMTSSPFWQTKATGAITDGNYYAVTDDRFAAYTDGNTSQHYDMRGFNTSTYRVGGRYELSQPYYIGNIVLYASIGASFPEVYSVYASNSAVDLLSEDNCVLSSETTTGTGIVIPVNASVQYIAFVCEDYTGNPRFKEIEAWTAEEPETPVDPDAFTPVNVLNTNVDTSRCIQFYPSSYYVDNSTRISSETISSLTDGVTTVPNDCYDATGWDPARYIGVEYTLDDTYYVGDIKIYSGNSTNNDTFDIYASDSLETLYSAASLVDSSIVCSGASQTVTLNKYVKYITFLISGTADGIARISEFQAITAPEPFASENVLLAENGKVDSYRQVYFNPDNYYVDTDSSHNTSTSFANFTDGNLTDANKQDLSSGFDWDDPKYLGMEYTLDDTYLIGNLNIYSGYASNNAYDTFEIYASDSFGTLYNAANLVATDVVCTGAVQTIELNREVKYITFLVKDCGLYCARIAEFEAWTADPEATEPVSPSSLKVLTIGNSFAENASIYASEIALANGKNLTFGYLKSPSCSIEKHYNAAVNDTAGFKFQVTAPDGSGGVTRTTIKDGDGTTVDNPDPEHGATIDEALDYMDWDVIVFQQESSSSRNYETFAYLDELVDYVHTACPDAKLMFHEVWRWGEWEASEFFGENKIKQNAEKAARENGLELIASGLAFEYARQLMDSATYPNENDGNWQHANTQGQYLAGVAYVDALFGIQCSESAFASHPYINADSNVAGLTECANKAARYYKSYGDLDFDGEINAEDLTTLIDVLLAKDGTEYDATLADVNNDGYINVVDIVSLKKKLVALDEAE